MTCGIRSRTVNLRRILARESTAAVRSVAAISVDYDFAAGKAGISVRAAYHKLARGVDVEYEISVKHCRDIFREGFLHARYENVAHIAADNVEHAFVGLLLRDTFASGIHELVVLGRHHYGVDAYRAVVLVIFYSDLALGVGAQICHVDTLAAYLGKRHQQAVAQSERQRYVERCFVGGIAEHHTLVAGSLKVVFGTLDASVDIGALLVHGKQHAARITVEAQIAAVVAYLVDNPAGGVLHIHICLALDFSGNDHLPRCHKCFASHLRLRIAGKKFVKNSVGYLVGNLVGMPFRYRFRCK